VSAGGGATAIIAALLANAGIDHSNLPLQGGSERVLGRIGAIGGGTVHREGAPATRLLPRIVGEGRVGLGGGPGAAQRVPAGRVGKRARQDEFAGAVEGLEADLEAL